MVSKYECCMEREGETMMVSMNTARSVEEKLQWSV